MVRHQIRRLVRHNIGRCLLFLTIVCCLTACYSSRMRAYYTDQNNYITVTGTITKLSYSQNGDILYLCFDNLSSSFDDNAFKMDEMNLMTAKANGISEKLTIGDTIEFTTAPRYFGDGYFFPILSITVDGKEYLSFEEGYSNFIKKLQ